MCRLMAYVGPDILVADVVLWPSRSIIKQSYEARERRNDSTLPFHLGYGNLNGDGFGIGWYSSCMTRCQVVPRPQDTRPCTFTSVTPAWNNDNLNRLAMKLDSGMIFAHVRAAYPGMPVSEQNCHPFAYENYMFMHNGVVAGFLDIRRQLIGLMKDEAYNAVQSFHSDSAVSFGLFLHHLPDMKQRQTPETLLRAVQATVSTIRRVQEENGVEGVSLLNFVVTDGVTMVATRYASDPETIPASLYYAEGYTYERSHGGSTVSVSKQASETIHSSNQPAGSATGMRGGAVMGEGDYVLTYAGTETRVCLVASEPVTECSSDWNAVEPNTALVISKDCSGILTVFKAWIADEGEHPHNAEVYRCLETIEEKMVDDALHLQTGTISIVSSKRNGSVKSGASSVDTNEGHLKWGKEDEVDTPRYGSTMLTTASDPAHSLSGHVGPVTTVASTDSLLFSGGADGLIKVWTLEDYTCVKTLVGHRDPIRRIDFAGPYLMSAGARTIRIWNLETYECISVVNTNLKGSITALASDVDGAAYVGSVDCRIKKYCPDSLLNTLRDTRIEKKKLKHPLFGRAKDLENFQLSLEKNKVEPVYTSDSEKGHCSSVTCLSVCDKYLCSGSHDATIRVWNKDTLAFERVLRGHRGSVLALTKIGGYLLSGGRDSVIRVWDLDTWVCCEILRGHDAAVLSLSSYEALGLFVSSSADGTVRLWDLQTFTCAKIFEATSIHSYQKGFDFVSPPCMACILCPPFVVQCSDEGDIFLHDGCVDDGVEEGEDCILRAKSPDILLRKVTSKLEISEHALAVRIEREFEKALKSFIKIKYVQK